MFETAAPKKLVLADFAAWARRIRKSVRNAEELQAQSRSLRPAEKPEGVLVVHCYQYFRRLKRADKLEELTAFVNGRDPERWFRHPATPMDWVFRLIETESDDKLTSKRRGRIVLELNLADRWDIHPRLLLAFLYEAGPHQLKMTMALATARPQWAQRYEKLSQFIRDEAIKPSADEARGPPETKVSASADDADL